RRQVRRLSRRQRHHRPLHLHHRPRRQVSLAQRLRHSSRPRYQRSIKSASRSEIDLRKKRLQKLRRNSSSRRLGNDTTSAAAKNSSSRGLGNDTTSAAAKNSSSGKFGNDTTSAAARNSSSRGL